MFLVIVISTVSILFYPKITIFIAPLSAPKLAPKVTHKTDHKASPKVPTKDAPKAAFNVSPKVALL